MAKRFCGQCGKPVAENEVFCTHCGAKASVSALTTEEPAALGGRIGSLKSALNESTQNDKTRKIATIVIAIVVVIAVSVAAAVSMLPKQYRGYPSEAIKAIGVVEPSVKHNIVAEITATPSFLGINEGATSAVLDDPIDSKCDVFATLKEPATRRYTGTIVVKGRVMECDGVDRLFLIDATIVRGS